MPDFQIKKTQKSYDVCIVGSGAGGGMAAYVLANAGIKVVLLEAGPLYDPAKNVTQLKWPWESPRRGASTPYRHFGDFDAAYGGWEIEGEPYTHKDEPSSIGSVREWLADEQTTGEEFPCVSVQKISNIEVIDGLGDDWPISYDDVAPFYDKVEN